MLYCEGVSINPFLANVAILHPLKSPENQRFSGDFRGCKMGTLEKDGLVSGWSLPLKKL